MYCKIIYEWTADRKLQGDYVLGDRTLHIGQTNACDIRIPKNGNFEPEIFATLLPAEDDKGWYIVRRTDLYDLSINGRSVAIASALNGGDKISISYLNNGERIVTLKFEFCRDICRDMKTGVVYGHKKNVYAQIWLSSVVAAIALGLAVFILASDDGLLRHEDFSKYEQSVLQIITDSVFLVEKRGAAECVIESAELDIVEKGTCFLTEDGLLVTSRHCIEPWIYDEKWIGTSDTSGMSLSLRMATDAETWNRQLGEERYYVRSHSIVLFKGEQLDFYSSDFSMDKSRDMILCLGDEDEPVYMRTLVPLAGRRNMELGDFAYVQIEDRKGAVSLATMDDLLLFDKADERDIVVMGYPINDNMTDRLNAIEGMCQSLEIAGNKSSFDGCIQMSAAISHGYSGGPVFVRIKGKGIGNSKLKVIGLVSKYDTNAEFAAFWAVPSTEILDLYMRGGEIADETFMYRR